MTGFPTRPAPAPPDGQQPPGHRRSRPLRWAAVLGATVLVVGAAAWAIPWGSDDAAVPVTTAPSTTPDAPGSAATELDEVVGDITEWLEEERGLEFLRPVEVELLARDDFVERYRSLIEEDREETEATERILIALGFLEPGVDLLEAQLELSEAGVVGFYDTETDELVVRADGEITPATRLTIAHELVHALEDQHFELNRPALDDAVDESGYAFTMLVEGSARFFEIRYLQSLPTDEQNRVISEQIAVAQDADLDRFPPFLVDIVIAPYELGPSFVDALLARGGLEALDAAFSDPPVTTEQILLPGTYFDDEMGVDVPQPPAGGEVFDEGVFGQLLLLFLVDDVLDPAEAGRVAVGWGGDWYVAWEDGDRTCVRVAFEGDSPLDTDEIEEGLRVWAAGRAGSAVDRKDGIATLTACS